MSRVSKVELFDVQIPLNKAFQPAWYEGWTCKAQRMNVLRLTSESGHQGISAGWAAGEERRGLTTWLCDRLLGVQSNDIDTVRESLEELALTWGWRQDWVEAAFWDLRAKIAEKPVYQLLASDPEEVVSEIPVYASLQTVMPIEERRKTLADIQAKGFRAVKVPLSGNVSTDIATVRAIREHLGDDIALMVDAGQGQRVRFSEDSPSWKLAHAMDFVAGVSDCRIEWLEDPLRQHAYDDLAVLRSESVVPIAGGGKNAGWHEYKLMFEKHAIDIFQPDATFCGGVTTATQVIDACLRRERHFNASAGPSSFSMLVNLHLYASWPHKFFFEFPYESKVWTPEIRDVLLQAPIDVNENGCIAVPQEPGFGIQLDAEGFDKYATLWESAEE